MTLCRLYGDRSFSIGVSGGMADRQSGSIRSVRLMGFGSRFRIRWATSHKVDVTCSLQTLQSPIPLRWAT